MQLSEVRVQVTNAIMQVLCKRQN